MPAAPLLLSLGLTGICVLLPLDVPEPDEPLTAFEPPDWAKAGAAKQISAAATTARRLAKAKGRSRSFRTCIKSSLVAGCIQPDERAKGISVV